MSIHELAIHPEKISNKIPRATENSRDDDSAVDKALHTTSDLMDLWNIEREQLPAESGYHFVRPAALRYQLQDTWTPQVAKDTVMAAAVGRPSRGQCIYGRVCVYGRPYYHYHTRVLGLVPRVVVAEIMTCRVLQPRRFGPLVELPRHLEVACTSCSPMVPPEHDDGRLIYPAHKWGSDRPIKALLIGRDFAAVTSRGRGTVTIQIAKSVSRLKSIRFLYVISSHITSGSSFAPVSDPFLSPLTSAIDRLHNPKLDSLLEALEEPTDSPCLAYG